MPSHSSNWFKRRLPSLFSFINHMRHFPMPYVNWLWSLGGCLITALIFLIASGLFLAIHYTPDPQLAFASINDIDRHIPAGWFLRNLHQGGAFLLFIALYIHIGRGLWYGSYKSPREIVWISGLIIFILLMISAFCGYVLPWGQLSYWGAHVITKAISSIPYIGPPMINWLLGETSPGTNSLHRFFIVHLFLGFFFVLLVIIHVIALHDVGVTDRYKDAPQDTLKKHKKLPFYPYYVSKDLVSICFFLILYSLLIFFFPHFLENPANLIPANPLKTPNLIVPEWYLAPYFAMLRAIPSQLGGLCVAFLSLFIFFFLPWLDPSPKHNATWRRPLKYGWILFFISFIILIITGLNAPTSLSLWISRLAIFIWFFVPSILVPWQAHYERKKK